MDKATLANAMTRLGAAYSRNVEQDQLHVFYDALKRFSNECVLLAVDDVIASQERFPTPTQMIAATAAVLRRRNLHLSKERGITESAEQPKLTGDERLLLARSGIGDARAALAAGLARRREEPEKEAES